MLLKDKTLEVFGTDIDKLSKNSSKRVCLKCDYCGIEYDAVLKNRNKGYDKLPKDACKSCRYIKREEIGNNPFSRPEVKEKIKQHNLQKYGVEWHTQSEEFKEKAKRTNLDKYGYENASKAEEIKQKAKDTNMKKYGVANPSQNLQVRKKREETMIKRFGSKSFYGSEECKNRIISKYGVENVFELDETKDKIKKTNLKKYGEEYWIKVPENAEIVSKKSLQTKIDRGSVITVDGVLLSEYISKSKASKSHFYKIYKSLGLDDAINYEPTKTLIERVINCTLSELGVNFNEQVRVGNYIPDFVCNNLIIECNGNYWHTEKFLKPSYHKNKREKYIELGYKPLFFTEDEILDKQPIVESIIKNKLGMSERIFARKTIFKEVPKEEGKKFLEENHLMGKGSGQYFGLYYENTLYALLQLKNVGDGWKEISRFCIKNGYNIVGGFSKLIKNINHDKIKTFVDLRYGDGEHLKKIGFKEVRTNLSFHWTDGERRFHRMKFKGNSGHDLGLVKIWDCGQRLFEKC
jgi:very-short-patch-repair endonuclease/transposase-like protein